MSQPDTYCAEAHCGAQFEAGPHGRCPECNSSQVRRLEVLDWVEVQCQRIADELRSLEPMNEEERALIAQAVSALVKPQERAGRERSVDVLGRMAEGMMRLQARGGWL